MTTPQYIVLTVVNVIEPNQQRQGTANIRVINPPLRKLFPLPLEGNAEQAAPADRARFEFVAPPLTIRCAETFDDVVKAIERAGDVGAAVARPINRQAISAASGVALAETVMSPEEIAAGLQQAKDAGAVLWDEAIPMAAQPKAKPGDLRIANVAPQDSGRVDWRVQICMPLEEGENLASWEWGEDSPVPAEIRRRYSTRDEARLAVRTAGYGRRLIDG